MIFKIKKLCDIMSVYISDKLYRREEGVCKHWK